MEKISTDRLHNIIFSALLANAEPFENKSKIESYGGWKTTPPPHLAFDQN